MTCATCNTLEGKGEICRAFGLRGLQDLYDGDKPMPITTPVPRQYLELSERAFIDAFDDALSYIADQRTTAGTLTKLPSSAISTAHRLAVERFGCDSFPIPPTPLQREENLAHIRRRESGREIISLFSRDGKPGLKYLATERSLRRTETLTTAFYEANVLFHRNFLRRWGDRQTYPAILFRVCDHNGTFVGWSSRYLEPHTVERIDRKTGEKTTEIVKAPSLGRVSWGAFATPNAFDADAVAITESPINALTLGALGLPSIATISASNYRKPCYWPRVKAKRIIIAYDDDEAGRTSADALADIFGASRCERFTYPEGVGDPNEWHTSDADTLREYVEQFLEQANRAAV
jgi:hypothetical protein